MFTLFLSSSYITSFSNLFSKTHDNEVEKDGNVESTDENQPLADGEALLNGRQYVYCLLNA